MSADSHKGTARFIFVGRKQNMDHRTVPPAILLPIHPYVLEVVGSHKASYPTRTSMIRAYKRFKDLGILCRMYVDGERITGF